MRFIMIFTARYDTAKNTQQAIQIKKESLQLTKVDL